MCQHSHLVVSFLAIVITLSVHLIWRRETATVQSLPGGPATRNVIWLLWLAPLFVVYQELRMRWLKRHLTRSEELFHLISENAADMIAVVDMTGKRLYNSPAYEKVLGYTRKELAATSGLQQIHPDDQAKVREAADIARRTGMGARLEYRIRHKDGRWLVLESTASVVRNPQGKRTSW